MSEVTIRYFVAEGEKAERVIKEGLEKRKAISAQRSVFVEKYGADGTSEYSYQAPHGLAFNANKCDGADKPGFLKPVRKTQDGVAYYEYRFDKRTKVGKALIEESAGLAFFDFSMFAVREFDVRRVLIGSSSRSRTGSAMYQSVAGICKGKLVFKIPEGGEERNEQQHPIPAEFRELKKSEFIALTEE